MHKYHTSDSTHKDPFGSYTIDARTNIPIPSPTIASSHPLHCSSQPHHNHGLPHPHSPKKGLHPLPTPIHPPNPSNNHNNTPIHTNPPSTEHHYPNKQTQTTPPPNLPLSPPRQAPRPLLHKLPNNNPNLSASSRPRARLHSHSTDPRRAGRRLPRRLSAATPARGIRPHPFLAC